MGQETRDGHEKPTELKQLHEELEGERNKVRRLSVRVEELEAQRAAALKVTTRLGALGTYLFVGPGLVDAFRKWLEAKSLTNPLPAEETAGVLAAIVKRVAKVGWLGLAVAALPLIVLVWQSFLLQSQNRLIQEQINQQFEDTRIVRRAQLLDIIYEEECEVLPLAEPAEETSEEIVTTESICKPKASARARQEAVLAFIQVERGNGVENVDLTRANLSRLRLLIGSEQSYSGVGLNDSILVSSDLSFADLRGADLRNADLSFANLSSADLSYTKLDNAILLSANLGNADLRYASLRGAHLVNADMSNANLSSADLVRAHLRYAQNLTQGQLNTTNGTVDTHVPEGLERPAHWLLVSGGGGQPVGPE